MPNQTETTWQQAKLLPKFYEKSALGASGLGNKFTIAEFGLGYGFIDDSTEPPTIKEIPDDTDKVPDEWWRQELSPDDFIYTDGRLLIRMTPNDRVDDAKKFSVTGLYDQDGDLVAISVELPDYVTPSEALHLNGYIAFLPEAA
ncbi:hypothetical protein [Endozoicomonas lisbonensis]|uniref:Phage tail protein n=1 Tax=Endozoicomonas lisbonensis TaxID=3120522 RepID=A0ABV2SP65_9GAMM